MSASQEEKHLRENNVQVPKISVVIPSYNGEAFIGKAIRSVLNQTFQDFEVLVVDDCSTDGTRDEVRRFEAIDKRVRLFTLKKNSGGPASPSNLGIGKSRGEYVSYLDQDDIYLPDSLEKRWRVLQGAKTDVLIANMWVVDLRSNKFIDYLNSNFSSFIISRKMFDKGEIGLLSEEASGIDEYEWSLRYRLKNGGERIRYFEEPAVLYARHPGQMSESHYSEKSIKDFLRRDFVVLKWAEMGGNDFRVDLAWIYFWIGYRYGLLGEFDHSRRYLEKSLDNGASLVARTFLLVGLVRSRPLYVAVDKAAKWIKKIFIKRWRLNSMVKKYPASYRDALAFYGKITS